MLPDRVSNPGPLTYESGVLPIALRGPASLNRGGHISRFDCIFNTHKMSKDILFSSKSSQTSCKEKHLPVCSVIFAKRERLYVFLFASLDSKSLPQRGYTQVNLSKKCMEL